jgi:hypothetical protein
MPAQRVQPCPSAVAQPAALPWRHLLPRPPGSMRPGRPACVHAPGGPATPAAAFTPACRSRCLAVHVGLSRTPMAQSSLLPPRRQGACDPGRGGHKCGSPTGASPTPPSPAPRACLPSQCPPARCWRRRCVNNRTSSHPPKAVAAPALNTLKLCGSRCGPLLPSLPQPNPSTPPFGRDTPRPVRSGAATLGTAPIRPSARCRPLLWPFAGGPAQ